MAKAGLAHAGTQWSTGDVMNTYLRYVDPVARAALNEWLTNRGEAHFSLAGQDFQLSWSGLLPAELQFGLVFAIGSQRLALSFDSFAAFDPLLVGAPFSHMPVPMKNLAVEHLAARFLAKLPGVLADTADLRAVYWDTEAIPRWECALGLMLQRSPAGAVSRGVFAVESPETLAWLHEQLPASAPRASTTPRDFPMALQVVVGYTRLANKEVRGLDVGDVVWIDTARLADDGIAATLFAPSMRRTWACRVQHRQISVVTPSPADGSAEELARLRVSDAGRRGATAVKPEHGGNLPMNTDLSDFEVPVTFDLGELSVAFEALEHIQPGYLFELPQEVTNASVALRISGSMIARGQLVAVGRRLGVRITNLTQVERDS